MDHPVQDQISKTLILISILKKYLKEKYVLTPDLKVSCGMVQPVQDWLFWLR